MSGAPSLFRTSNTSGSQHNQKEFENAVENLQVTAKTEMYQSCVPARKTIQHLEKTTSKSQPFSFKECNNLYGNPSSDTHLNEIFENKFFDNENNDALYDIKIEADDIDDIDEDGNSAVVLDNGRPKVKDNCINDTNTHDTGTENLVNMNPDSSYNSTLLQGSSEKSSLDARSKAQEFKESFITEEKKPKETFTKDKDFSNISDTCTDSVLDEPDFFDSDDEFTEMREDSYDDMLSSYPTFQKGNQSSTTKKDRYCVGVDQYLKFPIFMRSIRKFASDNKFEIANPVSNGNCMFHAISDQLHINGEFNHTAQSMRQTAVRYLRKNPHHITGCHLEAFLFSETWEEYLTRMEKNTEWGDHMMLKALSDALNLTIIVFNVYEDDVRQTEIIPEINGSKTNRSAVYLGHIGEFHYLSLRPLNWEKQWPFKALVQRLISFYPKFGKEFTTSMVQKRIERMGIHTYVDQAKLTVPELSTKVTINKENSTNSCSRQCSYDMKVQSKNNSKNMPEVEVLEEKQSPIKTYSLTELKLEENDDSLRSLTEDPFHVDVLTGIPMPHLGYFLRHSIPYEMIIKYALPVWRSGVFKEYFIEFIGSIMDETDVALEDCSKQRKIFLCQAHTKKRFPQAIVFRPSTPLLKLEIDDEHTHAGFCRLVPLPTEEIDKNELHRDESGVYLKAFHLSEDIRKRFSLDKYYAGYECQTFPPITEEMLQRRKPFNWPSAAVVQEILKSGCCLIQKPHLNSTLPSVEWQFNFSRAEKILTRRWSQSQRYVFEVFKIVIDYMTSHLEVRLKTKHLKAVFFQACEEIPRDAWYRCLEGCFLYVVTSLVKCLNKYCIPHYLFPPNNILDSYSREEIETICVYVEAVRSFPIEAIRFVSERHGLQFSSKLSESIFSECLSFVNDRNLTSVVVKTFIPNTIRVSKFLTKLGYYEASYTLLKDVFENVLLNIVSEWIPPSFMEFLKRTLHETRDITSRLMLAKIFDDECGTNLVSCYQNKSLKTLKEILPFEIDGDMGILQIPGEYITDLSSVAAYLDKFGYAKYKQRNAKVAESAFKLAIKCIKHLLDEQVLKDNEIKDETLKKEILSHEESLNSTLMTYYIHIYLVSVLRSTLTPLSNYMFEIEKLCEKIPAMAFNVSQMWFFLGETAKGMEYLEKFRSGK